MKHRKFIGIFAFTSVVVLLVAYVVFLQFGQPKKYFDIRTTINVETGEKNNGLNGASDPNLNAKTYPNGVMVGVSLKTVDEGFEYTIFAMNTTEKESIYLSGPSCGVNHRFNVSNVSKRHDHKSCADVINEKTLIAGEQFTSVTYMIPSEDLFGNCLEGTGDFFGYKTEFIKYCQGD